MIWTLTFDRASLSLDDLVIDCNPFAGNFHIDEDGAGRPAFTMRRSYAPDSAWVGGRQLLAAVSEAGSLPVTVYAHATTAGGLEAAVAELDAAASQFAYDLTVGIDGQSQTWSADPELPQWFQDSGMVRAHLARASWVIPLNPA